jgi:hypothetical protein
LPVGQAPIDEADWLIEVTRPFLLISGFFLGIDYNKKVSFSSSV